ncbi:hypothetical protein [Bdellovibrio sp. HCB274]|uniref:hypothetical protein n=1 Tax=Bdellovibrio sp. HCB274 TaxID=3394361 RepID=UPI0039B3694B
MTYRHFGEKVLITCVTFFALNAFAAESVKVDPQLAKSSKPEVSAVAKNRPSGTLILSNSANRKLKDMDALSKVEGPRTGGGGNSCALSITQNTEKMISMLSAMPNLLSEEQKTILLLKISEAKFYVAETLTLDGEMKDAINYPDTKEIFVSNRLCGLDLIEVHSRAMAILLHEYLGLARIDDRRYQISGAFLQNFAAFNPQGYTFTSDNSYYTKTGQCIQSVLRIQQIGNNFIMTSTSKPGARVIALTREQVEKFKAIEARTEGVPKSVTVRDTAVGWDYTFVSKSCDGVKCDFLRVQNENGIWAVYQNAINGMTKITCDK